MFDVDRTSALPVSGNVSRRAALRTGTFAALFAALLPHAAAANVEAPEQAKAPTKPYVIIDLDQLATTSRERLAGYRKASAEWSGAVDALEDTLSAEQQVLFRAVTEADTYADTLHTDLVVAELARHFPGLAPAIALVWEEHLLTQRFDAVGRCCVSGEAEGNHVD